MSKIGFLVIGSVLTLLAVFQIPIGTSKPSSNETESQRKTPAHLPTTAPVGMSDFRTLAINLNGGMSAPAPEQQAEERRAAAEQVKLARTWLKSTSVQSRIDGAEQLGAYPTAEAEKALVDHLRSDPSPEVRVAAANSLGFFNAPSEAATQALVRALEDHNADVGAAALSTLEIVLQAAESDPGRARQLHKKIRQAVRSRKIDAEIREQLRSLLAKP